MNLSEFASTRGITPAALTMYIKRHATDFEGHLIKDGKNTLLDETAIRLLNQKYPDPVSLVEYRDTPATLERLSRTEAKLDAAEQEARSYRIMYEQQLMKVNELQEQLNANIALVAESKSKLKLLEDQSEQLRVNQTENRRLTDELQNQIQKTHEESKRADLAENDSQHLQQQLDDVRGQLDEAKEEAASYKKSIFGFFRKIK